MRVDDHNASAHDGAPPGGDYNLLPYPSMPIAYTQPARLAALTALFGLTAPAADRARVLELGCASGGNIIPLAARFPSAHFVGIDLSQRHIDDGWRRIAALGLANIELRQGDLTKIAFARQQFDYVICHGVFSWVPKDAQEAILCICRDTLAPNGVATISYNVLPGWHLRSIVRDICIHHVGKDGPPMVRVAAARRALELIATSVKETEAYGLLLRNEATRIGRRPAAYILGEFLVADNTPCYFHEFIEWAGNYGLSYLCEADLNSSIPEIRNPETRRRNRALAGSNPVALEQYIDFFTGRTFRRSVLIRSQQSAHVKRNRNFERLRSLHFVSAIRKVPSKSSENLSTFLDGQGRRIKARDHSVSEALSRLADSYPATLTLDELTEPLARKNERSEAAEKVCKAIFALVLAGQAVASTVPFRATRADTEHPKVWSLARMEASVNQPWLTTLNHLPVPLRLVPVALLPHLDGNNDCETLREFIVEALMHGSIKTPELPKCRAHEPALLGAVAEEYLQRALSQLAAYALLEAS
jgi:methyltransferase-like protein/trans-aconitate methyltransferase